MKTLPCALCRPSIVTMIRAADAGPAMKINARAEEKNRLRQRMLGVCSLGAVHLSRVAKILLSTGLKVGAERCHARSRQIRVLGFALLVLICDCDTGPCSRCLCVSPEAKS